MTLTIETKFNVSDTVEAIDTVTCFGNSSALFDTKSLGRALVISIKLSATNQVVYLCEFANGERKLLNEYNLRELPKES